METIVEQLKNLNLNDTLLPITQTSKINLLQIAKLTLHLYKENIVLKNEIERLQSFLKIVEPLHIPKWIM